MADISYDYEGGTPRLRTNTVAPNAPNIGAASGVPPMDTFMRYAAQRAAAQDAERRAREERDRRDLLARERAATSDLEFQRRQAQQDRSDRVSAQDRAEDAARLARADAAAATPKAYGRFQMNHLGNWGTFVDPANIPAHLQDKIMGGFHGDIGNWDSSNPQITGPQQFASGKYQTRSAGTNFPDQVRPEPPPVEEQIGFNPYATGPGVVGGRFQSAIEAAQERQRRR